MRKISTTVKEKHIYNVFKLDETEKSLSYKGLEKLVNEYVDSFPKTDLGWNWHIKQIIDEEYIQVVGVFD